MQEPAIISVSRGRRFVTMEMAFSFLFLRGGKWEAEDKIALCNWRMKTLFALAELVAEQMKQQWSFSGSIRTTYYYVAINGSVCFLCTNCFCLPCRGRITRLCAVISVECKNTLVALTTLRCLVLYCAVAAAHWTWLATYILDCCEV